MRLSIWAIGIAAIVTSGSAFAGDLGGPSPTMPFNWTGLYAGANVGGAWTSDKAKVCNGYTGCPKTLWSVDLNGSGVVGGLVAGYNWQLNSPFVVGVEGDIEAASLSSATDSFLVLQSATEVNGQARTRETLPWQGSLRARLGYAVGKALFYGTGGLAFARIDTRYSSLTSNPGVDSFSHTSAGWTLGAGAEYALSANWTARVEYRYASFGGFTDPLLHSPLSANPPNPAKNDLSENAVRFGVTYKFGQ